MECPKEPSYLPYIFSAVMGEGCPVFGSLSSWSGTMGDRWSLRRSSVLSGAAAGGSHG